MDKGRSPAQPGGDAPLAGRDRVVLAKFGVDCRQAARCYRLSPLVSHVTERRVAKMHRLLQHRVEHRRKVAGRGIDDAEYFGGRGLLFQRFARLID